MGLLFELVYTWFNQEVFFVATGKKKQKSVTVGSYYTFGFFVVFLMAISEMPFYH